MSVCAFCNLQTEKQNYIDDRNKLKTNIGYKLSL